MLWIVATLLVMVGLVGIVLPAIPGTILIFAGLLLAAWGDGFQHIGVIPLIIIGLIAVASYGVDFAAAALGAKRAGASRLAIAGAMLGSIVGVLFGLPGLILGPLVGALGGEFVTHRDAARAGRAGLAAWIGFLLGTVVKMGLAFSMVAIFLAALFWF
jgi:uncharacterized protein YqgC (DUF456 family)